MPIDMHKGRIQLPYQCTTNLIPGEGIGTLEKKFNDEVFEVTLNIF